jgi:hypothetical protein
VSDRLPLYVGMVRIIQRYLTTHLGLALSLSSQAARQVPTSSLLRFRAINNSLTSRMQKQLIEPQTCSRRRARWRSCSSTASARSQTAGEEKIVDAMSVPGPSRPCLKNSCPQCPGSGQTRTDANDPQETFGAVPAMICALARQLNVSYSFETSRDLDQTFSGAAPCASFEAANCGMELPSEVSATSHRLSTRTASEQDCEWINRGRWSKSQTFFTRMRMA